MIPSRPSRRALRLLRSAWASVAIVAVAWASPASAADGYSISNTITQQIVEHGVCRKVTNALAAGKGLYVPTKYDTEWNNGAKAFLNNVITGVSLAACLDAASLRFKSASSTLLSRTFSAGNRQTWTWSGWVKRGSMGGAVYRALLSSGDGNNANGYFVLRYNPDDTIVAYSTTDNVSTHLSCATTSVFRDVSAWHHVVLQLNTTATSQAHRIKLFINGEPDPTFTCSTWPALNSSHNINRAIVHGTGYFSFGANQFFDGYLADINFVDGQALTAAAFAEADSDTDQWIPKAYGGTYGTNGHHLTFANPASLGNDSSGGAKHWTATNFSTTAGTTYDPMGDYSSGSLGGNYPTWNPLDKATTAPLSEGNLRASGGALNVLWQAYATQSVPRAGKWYWEITMAPTAGWNRHIKWLGLHAL